MPSHTPEDFAKIAARYDALAVAFMQTRPDLIEMDLAAWVHQHMSRLSNDEYETALAIINLYEEKVS